MPSGALVEELVSMPGGLELMLLRPRDSEALLDEHAFEEDEFLPYWAELWPSGVALAQSLRGRRLRGRRVLELGCGLGLPSLVAAGAGARVVASDWSQPALELLESNAAANGVALETLHADWAAPVALLERAPFDLVLAADVLYERRNVALLLKLLPQLGDEVWLADPRRAFTDAFLDQAPRFWSVDTRDAGPALIHRLQLRAVS